jgi:hypothetical protein
MNRLVPALAALLLAVLAAPARAQIDDARRFQLEGGYEDGVGSPGPNGAYVFAYLNRPGVLGPGSALRLAVAPVYLDAELGLPNVLPRTDLGLGFTGGGYAFSQKEVVRGDQRLGESYIGHGGGPSVSLYPRLGNVGPVPLNGVLRLSALYTDYQRTAETAPNFVLPPDEWTGAARAGLRLGGQEPGLDKGPAMELSTWWESRLRDKPATFGYDGDRSVRGETNLYWMRFLLALPTDAGTRYSGGLSVGGGDRVGRLSAYHLGGMLTQTSEFPLVIPGYFSSEIEARKYGHVWGRAGVPLDAARRWLIDIFAAGANVAPIRGTDPGGTLHAGVGTGVQFVPPKGALHAELAYGYAPTALRGTRRGGHSVALSLEIDFVAPEVGTGNLAKTRQQGLGWLFGR